MNLLERFRDEYYRRYPQRTGKPINLPDWFEPLCLAIDKSQVKKLPAAYADGHTPQPSAKSRRTLELDT